MRDILLFPKFKNMEDIEVIRKECDNLYGIIGPHITIVFPFEDKISDEDLIKNLRSYFKDIKKFYVKFKGVSFSDDDYIFLNCIDGEKEVIRLHDELYKNYFLNHLSNRKYIPHITLGQISNSNKEKLEELKNMKEEFECYIDTVVIEKIGDNDESIILDEIKLN